MTDTTIAKTILEQLGGNKFLVMTGARNLLAGPNTLSFRLPARFAKDGITLVKISLDVTDTYTMSFKKVNKKTDKLVSEQSGVYDDMLASIFEEQTGLRTHL
jgi:hypothetical protein